MAASEAKVRQTKLVVFEETSSSEERMAAVLITKDANGTLKAYVKDVPGRNQPNPESVALLLQAVELANL